MGWRVVARAQSWAFCRVGGSARVQEPLTWFLRVASYAVGESVLDGALAIAQQNGARPTGQRDRGPRVTGPCAAGGPAAVGEAGNRLVRRCDARGVVP